MEYDLVAKLSQKPRVQLALYAKAFHVACVKHGEYVKNADLVARINEKYEANKYLLVDDWYDHPMEPWLMWKYFKEDVHNMSVENLRKYCSIRCITDYKGLRSDELIAKLDKLYEIEK
jgi:hypothetical protein